eukprot:gene18180-23838_t
MKGKGGKIPIDQRGEFMKRQKIQEYREQVEKNKPTGVPIFKIFVRLKTGGMWLPCGDLAGDARAASLVNAWTSGFLTDVYKGQLDSGVARSIFSQEDSFVKSIVENYKPFRKCTKAELEFGYKVDFPGVTEKFGELKVTLLSKDMEKGFFDKAKDAFTGFFKQN